ncbi:MAG TPA: HD domain-containing protein [Granulicella sp.]|nr:HD domain-containing protein [Granulicella sp.]
MPNPISEYAHTRDHAWQLLQEWTASASLLRHGLAVEACTRSYGVLEAARLQLPVGEAGRFVELYAIAGLLHDFDYDRHPSLEEHPFVGVAHLREQGWPELVLHAILAHADYSGTPRESHLDKALFACDELAGFLTACAFVKPSKSIHEVEVAGVKKKIKDKAFARAVKREDITDGAALLGLTTDEHIENCLRALQSQAEALGLAGTSTSVSSVSP